MANEDVDWINIRTDYLKQVMDYSARATVGKLMKRFELLDDLNLLKKNIKEVLYESYRDTTQLLLAYGKGVELTEFRFQAKEK